MFYMARHQAILSFVGTTQYYAASVILSKAAQIAISSRDKRESSIELIQGASVAAAHRWGWGGAIVIALRDKPDESCKAPQVQETYVLSPM